MINIKNIGYTQKIPFLSTNNKKTKNTEQRKIISKKNIIGTLVGLSAIGTAAVLIAKGKKTNLTTNKIANELGAIFKNGLAYDKKGEIFNGEITKINSSGEKFNILIKNGKIQKSTKISSDGVIAWVKKYSQNKYGQNITSIFTPKENNEMELAKTILTSKDKVAIFKGENVVDKYWFNTPLGWKRIDSFIDKNDIHNYMAPENYYSYNGIQINRFLREGEFAHPNIQVDRISYERLDDPNCKEYIKKDIRKIMTDNRYILDAIDDLDKLTQTSKTSEPMTVYRNAPRWWVQQAQDGILLENSFCSTSTKKGASMEGLYVGKHAKDGVIYTIHLPKDTPFYDLTYTSEKEMLLPRKGRFRVIGETELEYIPE